MMSWSATSFPRLVGEAVFEHMFAHRACQHHPDTRHRHRDLTWRDLAVRQVLNGAMTTQQQSAFDLLADASQRLTRTVDGFHADDWTAPSQLPEWTRAHVVAHLALNAEGIARCLRGVVADDPEEPATMYDSTEQRDSDIADLAGRDPAEIRDRLLAATTLLNDAVLAVPDDGWDGRVERTPGGRSMPTSALPGMRLREVEIHHVDLVAGYTAADWSPAFATRTLNQLAPQFLARGDCPVAALHDTADHEWQVGTSGPTLAGSAPELVAWLTGRSDGASLTPSPPGATPSAPRWS
jgi:maleylpyruvate isomerase